MIFSLSFGSCGVFHHNLKNGELTIKKDYKPDKVKKKKKTKTKTAPKIPYEKVDEIRQLNKRIEFYEYMRYKVDKKKQPEQIRLYNSLIIRTKEKLKALSKQGYHLSKRELKKLDDRDRN